MNIVYKKSQSTVKPDLIDSTSSKKYTYIRKDLVERQNVDDVVFYEYDEAKLTKQEYEKYLVELSVMDIQQQRADIDYIALMTGVDLEG